MPNLPPTPDAVMNLFKFNCTKSNRRTGKCICKIAKLYYASLFACSLDNDAVCENKKIDDKSIMDIIDVED